MLLEETNAVVAKLFGKTHEEANKQFYPLTNIPKHYLWGAHYNASDLGGYTISIGWKGYSTLISFSVDPYPSCCGSRLFHTFKVDPKITQEQLDEILNAFFRENRGIPIMGACNRIEVVMVEKRYTPDGGYVYASAMEEPQPVENPDMKYKTLWNYFHKYAKRVRTRLEVNENTRNVLHNMEVIL